jgi:O-antigen/teichoic acid export membrane protein
MSRPDAELGAAVRGWPRRAAPSEIPRRVHAGVSEPLFRNAYSLMLNTILTAALGLGFWIVAARLYSPDVVGRDGALLGAMLSLSSLCGLNLHNVLLRFLPTLRRHAANAVLGAYTLSAVATALVATGFVVLMPAVSDEFEAFSAEPALSALYVAATVLWTVFALQDAALTALRRASWIPVENATFGVLKLAALPLLLGFGASAHGIFIAWVVPMAVLVLPVNYLVFRRLLPAHARLPAPADNALRSAGTTPIVRFAMQDYAAFALNMAALTLLPVLVVALLGSSSNAYFYMAFTIVVTFDLLFLNVAASLTVEGAYDEARVPLLVRSVVRRFARLLVPGVLFLVVAAPLVLLPFGSDYARQGTTALRLMALASLFRAVIALYIAISRLRGRGGPILRVQSAFSVVLVVLAVLLSGPLGVEGVALAWLIAAAVVALAVAPFLLRYLRAPWTETVDPATAPALIGDKAIP